MSLTPARRNPTRSFNRGDSYFNVGAAGAFDPAVKENVKFDDEAPKGMHQSHHTALTKHGYEYTGRNGSGAHTYRHQRTGSTAEHKGGTTSLLPHGRPQLQIRTSSASELHSHLQKYHGELSHPLNRDAGGRMSDGQPEATFGAHADFGKVLRKHGYRRTDIDTREPRPGMGADPIKSTHTYEHPSGGHVAYVHLHHDGKAHAEHTDYRGDHGDTDHDSASGLDAHLQKVHGKKD